MDSTTLQFQPLGFSYNSIKKEIKILMRYIHSYVYHSIIHNGQDMETTQKMEEGVAAHPSTPAWRIPWTEEPGELQSVGLKRLGHD